MAMLAEDIDKSIFFVKDINNNDLLLKTWAQYAQNCNVTKDTKIQAIDHL
jgi:hypothetical protein